MKKENTMKKLLMLAAGVVLAGGTAFAQPAQPSVTLTVTPTELTLIGEALQAQPYSKVAALLAKLSEQVDTQQKAKAEPKK